MTRSLPAVVALALLAGSLLAIDDTPPPAAPNTVAALVAQLGNEDFAKREAAEKELSAIGEPALPAVRAACQSENNEVARRAQRIVSRITNRIENEKLLTPTLVKIEAEDVLLHEVLADLSAQSKYAVELGRSPAGTLLTRRVTVKTEQVPFWEALLAICDAADLQIASVAGFVAPDARPASRGSPRPKSFSNSEYGRRPTPVTPSGSSVVLEPRDGAKRRPAAVFGAVCVEAIAMPPATGIPEATTALLQVWPEPRLDWQMTTAVRVDRATDNDGQLLAADSLSPALQSPQVVHGNGVVMVKQPNGGVVVINGNANVPSAAAGTPTFTPNARQFVVRLRPGDQPSESLSVFSGSLYGTVRVTPEPLVEIKGLGANASGRGSHPSGTELNASLTRGTNNRWRATADLTYDRTTIQPASAISQLPNGGLRSGNHIVNGIRVTDANGNAFGLAASSVQHTMRGNSTFMTIRTSFDLIPTDKTGEPDAVTFWGTYPKAVDVPFSLKDVAVVGGKK